jgi:hypothetical protein
MCVDVSPLITLNRLVALDEMVYEGDAIEGDPDVLIYNPMSSNILKRLTFKCRHSAPLSVGLG